MAKTNWRVVVYRDDVRRKLVILDAFMNHRGKSVSQMVNQVEPLAAEARRLLGEGKKGDVIWL